MTWEQKFLTQSSPFCRQHTHTPLSRTTRVSRYQKGKTNLDFTVARDSECQWHQLGHMQVCTSLQTDNHASTRPLSFLQTRCPSCHPTNSVKALKAYRQHDKKLTKTHNPHDFTDGSFNNNTTKTHKNSRRKTTTMTRRQKYSCCLLR